MTDDSHPHLPDMAIDLASFAPISLEEMDSVRLLDRVDTKYVLPRSKLHEVLAALTSNYRVLTIGESRLQTYATLYFDTADSLMYRMHHNGYARRIKVRKRWYVGSNLAFFEIKRRTNKKRTLKSRTRLPHGNPEAISAYDAWIQKNCPFDFGTLEPKTWTQFERITLVNNALSERVTIDCNLGWISAQQGDQGPPQGTTWAKPQVEFCVVEVKRSGQNERPVAMDVLRGHRLHPASFSKYCIGTALLRPGLKRGLFKPMLLNLGTLQT